MASCWIIQPSVEITVGEYPSLMRRDGLTIKVDGEAAAEHLVEYPARRRETAVTNGFVGSLFQPELGEN